MVDEENVDRGKKGGVTLQERDEAFKKILARYKSVDVERLRRGVFATEETSYGLWGATNLHDAYDFFKRIRLERFNSFADLGSGDGRVVLVASLFTKASGVEGEEKLVNVGEEIARELSLKVDLQATNYYDVDWSGYDVLFMFADQAFDERFIEKLKSEFTGYLFVYNDIYTPKGVPRGKTYWLDQLPIVSYPVNVTEEDLELV